MFSPQQVQHRSYKPRQPRRFLFTVNDVAALTLRLIGPSTTSSESWQTQATRFQHIGCVKGHWALCCTCCAWAMC